MNRAARRWAIRSLAAGMLFSGGCAHLGSGTGDREALARRAAADPEWVPVADGFDYPVGGPDADGSYLDPSGEIHRGWYVASGFLDPRPRGKQVEYHPGEDWNGNGMGDTDRGQPVTSIANGRVVAVRRNAGAWGHLVMIAHRLPDDRIVFSLYAHLERISVREGRRIRRGDRVGTIGKGGNDRYWAHLHFEIRRAEMAEMPATFWPGGRSVKDADWIRAHYIEPRPFLHAHRPDSGSDLEFSL